jgi:D-glycero-alpha-D-manno-heptose 1-phosphate guanylyltransferase
MTMEAIVLAGGLGTRLRSVVADLPKPMAPVAGRPFLAWLLDELAQVGFTKAILAVGYKHETIQQYFGDRHGQMELVYSIETEPLGTGGALKQALTLATAPQVFVINGDTHITLNYQAMRQAHEQAKAKLTIAACAVPDVGRFGAMDIDSQGHVAGFFEKGRTGPGHINGGVYLLAKNLLANHPLPEKFSFENDFLLPNLVAIKPLAFLTEGAFLDIGVPEDYARAAEFLGAVTA